MKIISRTEDINFYKPRRDKYKLHRKTAQPATMKQQILQFALHCTALHSLNMKFRIFNSCARISKNIFVCLVNNGLKLTIWSYIPVRFSSKIGQQSPIIEIKLH